MANGNFDAVKSTLASIAAAVTIGSGEDEVQMSFYTFSKTAKSYGLLSAGNSNASVQAIINTISFDGYGDRNIDQAITIEESEVTAANGLRSAARKILLIFSGDGFTGPLPSNSGSLQALQGKYDEVISIGMGSAAIKNNIDELSNFAGSGENLFFTGAPDQLQYVQLAILKNACYNFKPNASPAPTTAKPTQSPSVSCDVSTLSYDIFLILDNSNVLADGVFQAIKQQLVDFVAPYSLGSKTQVGVYAVALDIQMYYTSFENRQSGAYVLSALQNMAQGTNGKQQLVVYITGNTNFDVSPVAALQKMHSQYGVNSLVVKAGSSASATSLKPLAGGASCIYDVTASGSAGIAAWLQDSTCK
uniref:VWFA domain-containing protein n=1 Tax=Rhabditophanes sp. KR3021 TaxID=114890 RepID=A0AC35TQQ3_9BILA